MFDITDKQVEERRKIAEEEDRKEKEYKCRLMEKAIRAYDTYIETAENIKEGIKAFDGKICNVKVKNAIEEAAGKTNKSSGYLRSFNELYLSVKDGYLSKGDYSGSYIFNHALSVYITDDCYILTDTGKHRISAENFERCINVSETAWKDEQENLKQQLNCVDDMIEEINRIKDEFDKYKNRWDSSLRKLFDCDYDMRRNY